MPTAGDAVRVLRNGEADVVAARYLAMDESAGAKGAHAAVGIVASPIDLGGIIERAMVRLRNQVESNSSTTAAKRAASTIDRGWFHASKDASMARETLASALARCGRLDLHVAQGPATTHTERRTLFRTLSLGSLSLGSLVAEPGCAIFVPRGPIAETEAAVRDLFGDGARMLHELHETPPNLQDPQKQQALNAALETPANYDSFRPLLVDGADPHVQAADMLLWLFGEGKGTAEKDGLRRQFRPRKAPPFEHNGVCLQLWRLGR